MIRYIIFVAAIFINVNFTYSADYILDYDGMKWNTFSESEKSCIIAGIWIGGSDSLLDDNLSANHWPPYRDADNTVVGDYIKELNAFYGQPKHRRIKIIDACVLATIKLQGNDSNDYKYTLKMMLEGRRLPYIVTVSSIVDGNTIEVIDDNPNNLSANKIWKVRLIGIDAPEIDLEKQIDKEAYGMTVKHFLSGLALNQRAFLSYTEDLFDLHGLLLANVAVSTYHFEDGYKERRMSPLLLHLGLAKYYPYKGDPKRNYDLSASPRLYMTYDRLKKVAESAKDKSLYIWGGETDPFVEKFVKTHYINSEIDKKIRELRKTEGSEPSLYEQLKIIDEVSSKYKQ